MLALLTLAYALAILDRVSISLLIVPIEQALDVNDTQFGLLQGFAFSLVYSVLGLPLGLMVDRRKRVPLLVVGLALWSLATMGCALARSFPELFAARMFVGVGEAALTPVAASLIADFFPLSVRPKACALSIIAFGTAACLAPSPGWALFFYLLNAPFVNWSTSARAFPVRWNHLMAHKTR